MSAEPARRAAVLGSPIAHSLSPALHRAAYAELGLGWTYEAVEVPAGGLAGFVAGLDDSWAGLSLTMPLKPEALPLASAVSDTARIVGGANTLVRLGDGWAAHNTDVDGMVAALAERGVAVGPDEPAAVLGAGATGVSAVLALVRAGARTVRVAARRPDAARAALHTVAESAEVSVDVVPWDDAAPLLAAPLLVSTVPAGAADVWADRVPTRPGVLFDVLYAPWPTPLAAAWAAAGGRVLGGLDLLVHQAVLQVVLMTGRVPRVQTLREAGERALAARAGATPA